jgi:hypothetical protein
MPVGVWSQDFRVDLLRAQDSRVDLLAPNCPVDVLARNFPALRRCQRRVRIARLVLVDGVLTQGLEVFGGPRVRLRVAREVEAEPSGVGDLVF